MSAAVEGLDEAIGITDYYPEPRLCVEGTAEQCTLFENIDTLSRSQARKLEIDDPQVVAAGNVCLQQCANYELCKRAADAWVADPETVLPRELENVAVIGNHLLLIDGAARRRSAQEIDFEPAAVGSILEFSIDELGMYDRSAKSKLEPGLESAVYDFIVHGTQIPSEDLLNLLEIAKKQRKVLDKAQYKMPTERARALLDPRILLKAFKAVADRDGYGSNPEQGERYRLINDAVKGAVKSVIFEMLDPGANPEEIVREVQARNDALVTGDKTAFLRQGICHTTAKDNFEVLNGGTIYRAQRECLGCSAFGSCGIVAFTENSRTGGMRFAMGPVARRALYGRLGIANLRAAYASPDFPAIRERFMSLFGNYQQQLTRELFNRSPTESDKKKKAEIDAALESGLKAVLAEYGFIEKEETTGASNGSTEEVKRPPNGATKEQEQAWYFGEMMTQTMNTSEE